jgi:hypothetical protein
MPFLFVKYGSQRTPINDASEGRQLSKCKMKTIMVVSNESRHKEQSDLTFSTKSLQTLESD